MLLESLVALYIIGQNLENTITKEQKTPWWPHYELKTEQPKEKIEKRQKFIEPVSILCYHWIVPKGHKILSTARRYAQTIDEFRDTIKNYKKKEYKFITVTELDSLISNYDSMKVNLEDTAKYVMITIDDGLKCVYDYAYPIILSEKVKATLFIVNSCIVDSVVKGNFYLSWKELKEMYNSGLIDIQSHTYNSHFFINSLTAVTTKKNEETDEDYVIRLFSDFKKSKDEIETKIGNEHKVIAIAWPFGISNKTARRVAEITGFKFTFGVNGEKFEINKLKNYKVLPRIEVNGKEP